MDHKGSGHHLAVMSEVMGSPQGARALAELLGGLTDVMFCVKSRDGTYLAANDAFVRRTIRQRVSDVVGASARDCFRPERAQQYEAQDAEVFASGSPLRDQLEVIRRPSGELGWYLTTKLPIRDETGEIAALASVSQDLKTPTDDSVELGKLRPVVDHVRNNLGELIRVADLAEIAGCSPRQLERRMRSVFGLTPKQYVLRARVDRAAHLLVHTDLAIADIASQTGFYDQSDLTQHFSRLSNTTPGRFRSEHQLVRGAPSQ